LKKNILMEDYNQKMKKIYHTINLSKYKFLITGGAGFIGSNIVDYLIKNNAGLVRVVDDLSNGKIENISHHFQLKNFEFIKGDICDYKLCEKITQDIDFVSHQAALGSVQRSIQNPIRTNQVNIDGFLNILNASKDSKKVKKFVYAASSSTYGDSDKLPKVEEIIGKPLSPYAITKVVNEMYGDVFAKIHNFNSVGLRYFNVFGPRQSQDNAYAAVIPIFCNNFINGNIPTIYGDGKTSRDFTYVENVIKANIKALESSFQNHEVFNIACGERVSLLRIIEILNEYTNLNVKPVFKNERLGDVKHSLASLNKSNKMLNYFPEIYFNEGLMKVYEWYKKINSINDY
jgi:UDP-N-acetylglucosamine 4-epimerase